MACDNEKVKNTKVNGTLVRNVLGFSGKDFIGNEEQVTHSFYVLPTS